jgi:hypothetical protein
MMPEKEISGSKFGFSGLQGSKSKVFEGNHSTRLEISNG